MKKSEKFVKSDPSLTMSGSGNGSGNGKRCSQWAVAVMIAVEVRGSGNGSGNGVLTMADAVAVTVEVTVAVAVMITAFFNKKTSSNLFELYRPWLKNSTSTRIFSHFLKPIYGMQYTIR
jgi:hypothetical protein